MMIANPCLGFLLLIGGTGTLSAQVPGITTMPAQALPGSLVRISIDSAGMSDDGLANVQGEMAGEQLHFIRGSSHKWRAIGPVPVDAVDSVIARVFITRSSGAIDTAQVAVRLPRRPAPARASRPRRLSVDSRFTRPLSAETQARIERENERARAVGRAAHASPPRWTSPFLNPRSSGITSRFGSGRSFNGHVTSRHLGVDFAGATGSPVRAANRGIVALVDEFFLAGNVVYIDHGGGVVTGYFHLSETSVAAGDTVSRGQEIGRVGATGRVTGPHLHWSARFGAVTVNPLDLVALGTAYLRSDL